MRYRDRRPRRARRRRPTGSGPPATSLGLSTADLAAIGALPALLEAGVTSFKIEGRMKDPAYVAVTTAVYREALDAALDDPERFAVEPAWLARLEQSFSRSFTTAHLAGDHAAVRAAGRGGHRGVQIGRVEAVDEARGIVTVRVDRELHEADVAADLHHLGSHPAGAARRPPGRRPSRCRRAAERAPRAAPERTRERQGQGVSHELGPQRRASPPTPSPGVR